MGVFDWTGSVLDSEVYFPLAGYDGPGFHTWPSGHIPQDNGSETASSHPAPAKKTLGEAFGAATGVSDPRLQKNRGARATTLEPQIRNDYAGKLTSRRGIPARAGSSTSVIRRLHALVRWCFPDGGEQVCLVADGEWSTMWNVMECCVDLCSGRSVFGGRRVRVRPGGACLGAGACS